MNKKNNQQHNKNTKTLLPLKEGTEGWLDTNAVENKMTSPPFKGGDVRRTERVLSPQLKQDNNATKKVSLQKNTNTCHAGLQGELSAAQERDDLGCDPVSNSGEDTDIAVKVSNVSKIFKVPHKKIDSMKSAFVNSLKKNTYEEFYALKNISVEVKKGEFLGIIGHNGAGKSTLLKILAGVYKPTNGSIEVNGMISPFLELGIGFNPELSGRDNIYLNATVLGLTKAEIDKKFNTIVEFAELENFIDEQLKNYSSGMRARLAFSVSIHADREILIMDEVLAVGDSRFQEKCLNIFKGYKNQGKTVILVTHGISVVREYCDRAMLLHKGELLGAGNVDDVCDLYVEKNLEADQEKELEKKEKIEQKKRQREVEIERNKNKKNKIAYINAVQIFDEGGNELMQVTQGDNFSVEVDVEMKKASKDYFLAIQIFDNSNDNFLCGNNTIVDHFNCDWKIGKNKIKIFFKNIIFNVGDIYMYAILSEKKKQNIIIDSYSCKELNNKIVKIVKRDGAGAGIIRIEHEWSKK